MTAADYERRKLEKLLSECFLPTSKQNMSEGPEETLAKLECKDHDEGLETGKVSYLMMTLQPSHSESVGRDGSSSRRPTGHSFLNGLEKKGSLEI